MQIIASVLPYLQVILSVLLVGGILLQRSDTSMSGALTGGDGPATQFTRRGLEKQMFNATIIIAVLFVVVNFISFLV